VGTVDPITHWQGRESAMGRCSTRTPIYRVVSSAFGRVAEAQPLVIWIVQAMS
jgi:hypothetical protein